MKTTAEQDEACMKADRENYSASAHASKAEIEETAARIKEDGPLATKDYNDLIKRDDGLKELKERYIAGLTNAPVVDKHAPRLTNPPHCPEGYEMFYGLPRKVRR